MLYRYFQIKNQFYVISEIDFTYKSGLDHVHLQPNLIIH